MNLIARVKDLLSGRRQAYSRVFNPDEDALGDARVVLDDLMKFCHFDDGVYHQDQRMTDVLIGRQEVLHRILNYANLDTEALYVKYGAGKNNPRITEEQ